MLADRVRISSGYKRPLFVAVGENAKIAVSRDGDDWTLISTTFSGTFYDVAYGDNKFIAVGNIVAISDNGVNWVEIPNPFGSTRINSVEYGDGLWVIGGRSGKLATSYDGVNWTLRNSYFGNKDIEDIAFNEYQIDFPKWCIVGQDGYYSYSDNGINWDQYVVSGFNDRDETIRCVAFGKEQPNYEWEIVRMSGDHYIYTRAPSWGTFSALVEDGAYSDDIKYANGIWVLSVFKFLLLNDPSIGYFYKVSRPYSFYDMNSICYVKKMNKWLLGGENGIVLKGNDTATSWSFVGNIFGSDDIHGIVYGGE